MPLQTRSIARTIPKVTAGNFQPDTGLTVKIVDADAVGTDLFTLTESPASSGQYIISAFTPTPKFGYFKVGATVMTDWGRVWLGVEAQLRPVYYFQRVEVFDTADSPDGSKASPKTWTLGSGSLATDKDGRTPGFFSKTPLIAIAALYQERACYIANTPSVDGSGNPTFQTAMSDAGADYDSTHSYADIVVIQMD